MEVVEQDRVVLGPIFPLLQVGVVPLVVLVIPGEIEDGIPCVDRLPGVVQVHVSVGAGGVPRGRLDGHVHGVVPVPDVVLVVIGGGGPGRDRRRRRVQAVAAGAVARTVLLPPNPVVWRNQHGDTHDRMIAMMTKVVRCVYFVCHSQWPHERNYVSTKPDLEARQAHAGGTVPRMALLLLIRITVAGGRPQERPVTCV